MRRRSCSPCRSSSSLRARHCAMQSTHRQWRRWRCRRSDRARMRCWVWSKLERVSVWAWTRASSGASWREHGDGGGLIIDEDSSFAEARISRRRMISLPSESMPFSSRTASAAGVASKTHATTALSAPWRTISVDDLPPISSASASTRIDLPAPVSPVSKVEPRTEYGDGVIDDGVVFSAKLDEHVSCP